MNRPERGKQGGGSHKRAADFNGVLTEDFKMIQTLRRREFILTAMLSPNGDAF